jgi:hypothetical protein
VWVETDRPCQVRVLGAQEPTFEVFGHHYALVSVTGLVPASSVAYTVELNGDQVWPPPRSRRQSLIRTLDHARPQRIAFGSCRVPPQPTAAGRRRFGVDALEAYAARTAAGSQDTRPDLLLMLGDQVYADETSEQTQERIAARRGLERPPGGEVADFEEYTWLYHESWTSPQVRWLMSTVPVAMIFDDHDVHDDWNTSRAWREGVKSSDWWSERIIGALVSYWVYQHIGNLSPAELAQDDVYPLVRALARTGEDAGPLLREFARAGDAEADGAKGYRWSFWRDLGSTRLVVIDSRCGRILDGGERSMLAAVEFDWIEKMVDGDYEHLLIGTSLPWLLAPALDAIESWNEQVSQDRGRPRRAALGERFRQGADLEHWPAFSASFERLAQMLADVAAGRRTPRAPATICVLSGDVHHSYICEADLSALTAPDPSTSRIYQLTCSPLHNRIPLPLRIGFRAVWSRPVEAGTRALIRLLMRGRGVPAGPALRWWSIGGPVFGNSICTLVLHGRGADVDLETSGPDPARPLSSVLARGLSSKEL